MPPRASSPSRSCCRDGRSRARPLHLARPILSCRAVADPYASSVTGTDRPVRLAKRCQQGLRGRGARRGDDLRGGIYIYSDCM